MTAAADLRWTGHSTVAVREPYLTDNELQAIRLLADGATLEEAGRQLFKARGTIKTQVDAARDRWGARNQTHLVALALRAGLLE